MNPLDLSQLKIPFISNSKENEAPFSLICPITQDVMTNPVIDEHGHTFEEAAIRQWLITKTLCPMNQQPITTDKLVPNRALKEVIESYQVGKNCMEQGHVDENIPRPANHQNDLLAHPLIGSAQDLEQKGLFQDAEELYIIALKYTCKSEDYANFARLMVKKEEKERAACCYIVVADLQIAEKKYAEAIVTLKKSLELVLSSKTKEKLALLLQDQDQQHEAAHLFLELAQQALYGKEISHATHFCLKVLELFPALAEAWKTISAIKYEQDPSSALCWLLKGANEPSMNIKQRLELCRMVILKDPDHLQAKLLSFELNQLKMKDKMKRLNQAFNQVLQENNKLRQTNEDFKQETNRNFLLLTQSNERLKKEIDKNFLLLTRADNHLTKDVTHLQRMVNKQEVIKSNKCEVGHVKQSLNWNKLGYAFHGCLRNNTLVFQSHNEIVLFDPITFMPIFTIKTYELLSIFKELTNGQLAIGWKNGGISLLNPIAKTTEVKVSYKEGIGLVSVFTELANGQLVIGSSNGHILLFDADKSLNLKMSFYDKKQQSEYKKSAYEKNVMSILELADGTIASVGEDEIRTVSGDWRNKPIIKLWDSTTGSQIRTSGEGRDLKVLPDGRLSSWLSGGPPNHYDDCIQLWGKGLIRTFCSERVYKEKFKNHYPYEQNKFTKVEGHITLLEDGTIQSFQELYLGSEVKLWDSTTGALKGTIHHVVNDFDHTYVLSDGTLCFHNDISIELWDPTAGTLKRTIPKLKETERYGYISEELRIKRIRVLSDDTLISNDSSCVKLWNPRTGDLKATLCSSKNIRLETMIILSNGTLAASGEGIGGETIMLWDSTTGALKMTLYAASYIEKFLVLADGTLLSFDKEGIKAWTSVLATN